MFGVLECMTGAVEIGGHDTLAVRYESMARSSEDLLSP